MAPARIDIEVDLLGQLQVVVPAEREILRLALVIVVALDRMHAREGRGGCETIAHRHAALRGAGKAEREFDAAQMLRFLEMRIERVEGRMEHIRRPPFDRRHAAIALELVRLDIGLGTAEYERAGRRAAAGIAPGVVTLVLRRGQRGGGTQRDAERVAREFVDIGRRGAIAVARAVGVELVDPVHFPARADRDDALALIERAQHAQVDRARNAGGDERGVGGLVDVDGLEEFRGILIIFDAAIVADGDLFAAVEQRGREIGAEAADRQALVAAFKPLRGDAGQTRKRVGDRHVRQLADVFGGDRVHDQHRLALDLRRGFKASADAGDDDGVIDRSGCIGRRGHRRGGGLRGRIGLAGGRLDLRFGGRVGVGRGGLREGDARHHQCGGERGRAGAFREPRGQRQVARRRNRAIGAARHEFGHLVSPQAGRTRTSSRNSVSSTSSSASIG